MSAPDKAALRALAEKATPGEWRAEGRAIPVHSKNVDFLVRADARHWAVASAHAMRGCSDPVMDVSADEALANAAYIAAAHPQAVLALLDENARLREALIAAHHEMRFCDPRTEQSVTRFRAAWARVEAALEAPGA
jgi:hypothetical protein